MKSNEKEREGERASEEAGSFLLSSYSGGVGKVIRWRIAADQE
jgi:hypothetical protein